MVNMLVEVLCGIRQKIAEIKEPLAKNFSNSKLTIEGRKYLKKCNSKMIWL